MKMYASCPICGYKLCKGESGSDVDILCPRCGKLVRVVITETNTNCTPLVLKKKNRRREPPTSQKKNECAAAGMKKDGIAAVLWIFETGSYYSCPE